MFDCITKRLEIGERGGNRTHIDAVLQTAPYAIIGNSPLARSAGVAPTSWDLESQAHRYEYQDRIENWLGIRESNPYLVVRSHTFLSVILMPN